MSSTKFVFFGPIGKTRRLSWPLIGWDIFDFSSVTADRNSTKLDRKQDLNVLYQVCVFFGPIGKTRWPPWPLIGWDILDFFSETAERNWTKLDRKQDLSVLYRVCVFWADWKNKMAALADFSKRWHIVLRCMICGPLGLLFLVPFWCQIFDAFTVLRWATVARMGLLFVLILLYVNFQQHFSQAKKKNMCVYGPPTVPNFWPRP